MALRHVAAGHSFDGLEESFKMKERAGDVSVLLGKVFSMDDGTEV